MESGGSALTTSTTTSSPSASRSSVQTTAPDADMSQLSPSRTSPASALVQTTRVRQRTRTSPRRSGPRVTHESLARPVSSCERRCLRVRRDVLQRRAALQVIALVDLDGRAGGPKRGGCVARGLLDVRERLEGVGEVVV